MADNYSGATTPALVITGLTTALDGNLYRCRATNAFGAVFSEGAELTVNGGGVVCNGQLRLYVSHNPFNEDPFTSLADAQDAVGGGYIGDTDALVGTCWCYMYNQFNNVAPTGLVSDASTPNEVSASGYQIGTRSLMYFSLNLKAGSNLFVDYNIATAGSLSGVSFQLFSCDGEYDDSSSSVGVTPTGTLTPFNLIPADGQYILYVSCTTDLDMTVDYTVYSNDTLVAYPCVAIWNSGGGDNELPACP